MQDFMQLWQKNFNDYMEQSTALMTSAMGRTEEDKRADESEQDDLPDGNLFSAYANFWLAPLNALIDTEKEDDKKQKQKAETNSAPSFMPFFWDPASWPTYQPSGPSGSSQPSRSNRPSQPNRSSEAGKKSTSRKTEAGHNPFASFMSLAHLPLPQAAFPQNPFAQSSPFAAFQSPAARQDFFSPFKNQNAAQKHAHIQWPGLEPAGLEPAGLEHAMSFIMANPLLQQIAPVWQQALSNYWSEKFFDSFNPFKQKRSNLAQLLDPYDFGSLLEHMISTSMTSSLSHQPFGSFFETWTRKDDRQAHVLTLPFFDDLQNQAQQNLHESWKMLLQFSAAPLADFGAKV